MKPRPALEDVAAESLGTTVTVLKASCVTQKRSGVALAASAAMIDFVGMVMVQEISGLVQQRNIVQPNLHKTSLRSLRDVCSDHACSDGATGVRVAQRREDDAATVKLRTLLSPTQAMLILHSNFLIAMATGSWYARASYLFVSCLAGCVTFWADDAFHVKSKEGEALFATAASAFAIPLSFHLDGGCKGPFLIVTCAILLCTIVGLPTVGSSRKAHEATETSRKRHES